ncbi:hypothetical protein [Enterococcus sp. DIV0086]|uniref:hypothetical protein n=1 Tax=Enterococcus sp. DIV0086 TaxID=2774655 RepID=UPI003D2DC012
MKYFTIEGIGNPNSKEFSEAVRVLYAMSYGVKTAPKKEKLQMDTLIISFIH